MNDISNIVVTGPTASGKTKLAVALCRQCDGEIVSADSRQVYREMNIGTGKDLADYGTGRDAVAYHLIDICEPGEKYNVHKFQEDAARVVREIRSRKHVPVFCGGTGLYIEAVMNSHAYTAVPVNEMLRKELSTDSGPALKARYQQLPELAYPVDFKSEKRMVRAIEIQEFLQNHPLPDQEITPGEFICFVVDIPREERRRRISVRLHQRLEEGLVDEVRALLKRLSPVDMIYYGLEYKYVTLHLQGKMSRDELISRLETEIHRFAKRQMTWFRRMERQGVRLYSVNGMLPLSQQLDSILQKLY